VTCHTTQLEEPVESSPSGGIYLVRNATQNRVVATQVRLAGSSRQRRIGLSRHAHLGLQEGLLLTPCEAIHTFSMHFAIDVLFLTASGEVCGLREDLRPWRMAASWRARSTLELAAGTIRQSATGIGDRLEFISLSSAQAAERPFGAIKKDPQAAERPLCASMKGTQAVEQRLGLSMKGQEVVCCPSCPSSLRADWKRSDTP
jgi:uncharacterized membrane protein (UPF0127 family)